MGYFDSYNAVIEYIKKAKINKVKILDLSEAYYIDKDPVNGVVRTLPLSHIPKIIFEIGSLKRLIIDRQEIKTIPPEIRKLRGLEQISLIGNTITLVPKEIGQLVKLVSLDLSENQLTELPVEVCRLPSLALLNLQGNHLTSLPVEVGELIGLKSLNVSQNKLTDLPCELAKLSNLETISLNQNEFSIFPIVITKLAALKKLYIGNNNITGIPQEVGQLRELELLNLARNELPSLPNEITHLEKLTEITISRNRFIKLPDSLFKITKLRILLANYNQIESVSSLIKNLSQLEILSLEHNKINRLPIEIKEASKLRSLNLMENHLPIPPEILEKTDNPQAILNFYFSVSEQKRRSINALKLIIVGQGSVGKTSLVQRIINNTFNPNEAKTDGIFINHWQVENQHEITEAQSKILLNIWDFGGQEIMHATHQFFLTKRSLYLLVLDSRLTQEENRVEYWLKIIQSFGGESPALIVGNKIDQHPLDIDRTGLQKKYPNIVGILETSAATGTGIEELKAAISTQVNNLPHVRDLLPENWFAVKTKLEGLGRRSNFITHDKYIELCAENEVGDETSQRTLIGFLHDLGVVIHFQDDPRLESLGILKPQWVTNGVYKIINSHTLFQNKGVLTVAMLDEILNLPEYPRGKRLFIVDLMKKFELCYDIEPDKTFLVPDLLPKDQPDLEFDGIPAFEYAYPVLPSSVITRFIVRMNQKIDGGLVWRTGVLLKIGENRALVKADIEDKKITIAIDGLEHTRRDALSAIRYQLDEIHASIKGLNPQKMVPVPGAVNAEPLDYDYLLQLEQDGFDELPVKDGNRLVKVNVRQMLSGIESEAQRKESRSNVTNIYVAGDVKDSTLIAGEENEVHQNSSKPVGKRGKS